LAYIGNTPAEKYSAFQKQDFTTSATTSYTLDNPVANANELALFINFVRQEPTTAYSASGTTLTLTEATSASDDMYAIFLGKAIQTVTPADNTITNAMITDGAIDNASLSSGSFSNITGTGTLTNFTSTGIDDNATSTAMTIDSSGNVLISGTTHDEDAQDLAVGMCSIGANGTILAHSSVQPLELARTAGDNTERAQIQFWREGASPGQIRCTNTSTSYNTSSDHRLKENVVDMTGATTRLKQLSPKRFNFIANPNTTVDGFLAHEVSNIVPEAISGEKDAVDENGNPEYQGIDQSKLVPLLVKTIQELEARITELENK